MTNVHDWWGVWGVGLEGEVRWGWRVGLEGGVWRVGLEGGVGEWGWRVGLEGGVGGWGWRVGLEGGVGGWGWRVGLEGGVGGWGRSWVNDQLPVLSGSVDFSTVSVWCIWVLSKSLIWLSRFSCCFTSVSAAGANNNNDNNIDSSGNNNVNNSADKNANNQVKICNFKQTDINVFLGGERVRDYY